MGDDRFMRELREEYLKAAEGLRNRLTAMSDEFFRKPELGLEEERTSAMMQEALKEAGFSDRAGRRRNEDGFQSGSFGNGSPKIALLAEMDAPARHRTRMRPQRGRHGLCRRWQSLSPGRSQAV